MNQNKEVAPLPRAGTTTEIPGPYLSPEQTESFPLKSKSNIGKPGILRTCCWPCCNSFQPGGTQTTGGLRPVIACFFTFSLALTIALVLQIRLGEPQVLPHGSVASDSRECSQIGASILRKGGNAVDAAVATTICLGVVLPHLTGIGGGGFIAIYDHRRRLVVDAIDFREVAPLKADLESDIPSSSGKNLGGNTIGVPGFLKGLGLAHQLHGRLPWSNLIAPTINLCRTGFLVPSNLITAWSQLVSSASASEIKQSEPLFWDHFESLEAGHNMIDLMMANTLQAVASEGPQAFYNGSLTDDLIEAVINSGGQITRADLEAYKPVRRSLIRIPFSHSSWVYSMGAPSGGPLFLASLRLFEEGYYSKAKGTPLANAQDMTSEFTTINPSHSESITDILKNFSVKFTPTESVIANSTQVYVTPLPPVKLPSQKDMGGDVSLKYIESAGKIKDDNSKIVNKNGFENHFSNPIHNLNGTETYSSEELGKAIIEPFKLRRMRRTLRVDNGEDMIKASRDLYRRDVDEEEDKKQLKVLLKSLRDASYLHTQLGDPAFAKQPNGGSQMALDPAAQLEMIQKTVHKSEKSPLYLPRSSRPAGSNVAVVDSNELYVSVVSGLNTWFGSQVLTAGGYLLNNALADFDSHEEPSLPQTSAPSLSPSEAVSLPPSVFPSAKSTSSSSTPSMNEEPHKVTIREVEKPLNFSSDNEYMGGKRPLSSSVVAFVVPRREGDGSEGETSGSDGPEVGVEACGQRMVLGSADAISAAQVLVQIVFKGLPLVEGIEATRVKPLISPRNYGIEVGPEAIKWDEENTLLDPELPKGTPLPLPYLSVNGVQEIGDVLASHSDSRGGGVAARF